MTSTAAPAQATKNTTPKDAAPVEGSAYAIIKARLDEHGRALQAKVEKLNAHRQEVFGGIDLAVLANERVRTENNCVPRDILNVGGRLLFGYNVFIGLRKETRVEDVFALQSFGRTGGTGKTPSAGAPDDDNNGWSIDALPISDTEPTSAFLRDERFQRDFA